MGHYAQAMPSEPTQRNEKMQRRRSVPKAFPKSVENSSQHTPNMKKKVFSSLLSLNIPLNDSLCSSSLFL